ncbi:hypothetical protein BH10ACT1_BH10ACT1_37970 [soil metagenome]
MASAEVSTGSTTGWLAVALGGLGAGLLAGRSVGLHVGPCLLRTHAGFACPVCGLTRLADALAHGRVVTAVATDAAGVALFVVLALAAAAQIRAVRGRATPHLRGWALPAVLAGLLAAHWAVTLATGGFAPA